MTGRPPRQMPLDLPHAPSREREALAVGPANALAVALIDRWPDWPGPVALILGPPGSGKSHLAAVWAERAGAPIVSAGSLDIDRPLPDRLVLEDVDATLADEAALFHAINHVRQQGGWLMLTGERPLVEWPLNLPDLVSRLRAAQLATISAPDDALLRQLLVKLFADRQLDAPAAVLDYLVPRMERSAAAALALVEAIDREALAGRAPLSRPLAARVLAGLDPRAPQAE